MIWCICNHLKSLRSAQVCIAIHTSPATSFESQQCPEVSKAWLLEANRKGQEIHRCWKSSGPARGRVGKKFGRLDTQNSQISCILECRFTHIFSFWHWIHQCQASTLTCSIRIDGTMSGLGGLKLLCYHVNAKGIYRWKYKDKTYDILDIFVMKGVT